MSFVSVAIASVAASMSSTKAWKEENDARMKHGLPPRPWPTPAPAPAPESSRSAADDLSAGAIGFAFGLAMHPHGTVPAAPATAPIESSGGGDFGGGGADGTW